MILPLYDLLRFDYKRFESEEINFGIQLSLSKNRPITLKNTIEFPKDSILYRIIMEKPSRESFLSDYGQLIIETDLKHNFSLLSFYFNKEDFHLPNLTKQTIANNLDIKNCLEYKCHLSFEKLLNNGYALEDYELDQNNLNKNLLDVCKFIYLNNIMDESGKFKDLIRNNIPISYENELKAYLKYNQLLLRKNKIVKNILKFLHEFKELKKLNVPAHEFDYSSHKIPALSQNYSKEFNYYLLAYEKFLFKINHFTQVANHLKSTILGNMKDIKKNYLFIK